MKPGALTGISRAALLTAVAWSLVLWALLAFLLAVIVTHG